MRYWLFPLVIFIFQAIFTLSSMNQIRFEEVIETFRSPWWFQNGLVWNGSYSFLGWSGTLVFFYNIFGISLFTPKFVKLFFELISFFALAAVLKKYLGEKRALIPLLLTGISPSFIYFNSLSLSMGLEVSYFFILLFLISNLNFEKRNATFFKHLIIGIVSMFASLTYFGFLFFMPLLAIFYMYKINTQNIKIRPVSIFKNILVFFGGFIILLLPFFLFIQNRNLLIYDPLLGRGLFRSYGSVELSSDVFKDNIKRITNDLFFLPDSYYFEQKKVEFSDFYPLPAGALVIALAIVIFFKKKKYRFYIGSLLILFVLYFLLVCFIGPKTLGGLRRGTVLLIIFYGLFTILWQLILSAKKPDRFYKPGIITSAVLLLLHHGLAYPVNLENLKYESFLKDKVIFLNFENPEGQYAQIMDTAAKSDTFFPCLESFDKRTICPGSSLIYSLVRGTCYWNKLTCHNVIGWDEKINKQYQLNSDFWGTGPHTEP